MNDRVTIIKPGDKRKKIYGAGDEYTYFATGRETDGQYFFFEGLIPPGAGPSPHIQTKEEEAFYILEGEVTFWVDDEEVVAPKGSFINMPKGIKHYFKNKGTENAKMLFFFAPAGIEKMFDELANSDEIANNTGNITPVLNKIGDKYGVKFLED